MQSNPLVVQSSNEWPRARKLIFFICLVSFVFQLFRITRHYYRYETEFQTKLFNGHKEVLDLPAVTLCVEKDALFVKSSLKKKFPKINKYLDVIDKSNDSLPDKELQKDSVYFNFAVNGLTIKNFFDRTLKADDLTECYLDAPTIWMNEKKMKFLILTDCTAVSRVLESKVTLFGRSGGAKCFTFFSRLQPDINSITDLQINVKDLGTRSNILDLIVPMDQFKDSFGLSPFEEVYGSKKSVFLFIHDPYRMPSFEVLDSIELNPGKRYEIRFWPTTKSLLKPPFRSNCFDYHKNIMSKESSKSKDQCVHDCHLKKSVQYLNCLNPHNYVLNDEKLKTFNPRYCPELDFLLSQRLAKQCNNICHEDCHQTQYKFDYKESEHHIPHGKTPLNKHTSNFSLVHMNYERERESEYRERPVQSMCATIQAMFIALLIWFGLSIFSFSSIFEMAVNKAKPHMYYIHSFDDKVSPSVVSVESNDGPPPRYMSVDHGVPPLEGDQPMIKPKFTPTKIGSNVKLEHYNDFISKVVEGYPTTQNVELPPKRFY